MEKGLTGKRIAIGASRKTDEMCMLIKKQGGEPVVRSLQGTVILADKDVEPSLRKLMQEGTDWLIFTTGTGIDTLLNITEKQGLKEQFVYMIKRAKIASRGYKTFSTLKKLGVIIDAEDEDGTTRSLIRSLEKYDFTGKKVTVQLHGEKAPALIKFLEDKDANVSVILPYEHIAPQTEIVSKLLEELLRNDLDAVCFTTAIQVRSLFDFARENNCLNSVLNTFQSTTLAAAVGKVTAAALKEEGVERIVVPEHERMGAMVMELSNYYSNL